jgi:hypothetical protein
MGNFNIGDEVKVSRTKETGVITDKMYSEAKSTFMYVIKPNDSGRSIMRFEQELEPLSKQDQYKVEVDIADGVVIGVIYEVTNNSKQEVCRGHGHVIHEGSIEIAQACSYAFKKAFASIDNGIFLKQNRYE